MVRVAFDFCLGRLVPCLPTQRSLRCHIRRVRLVGGVVAAWAAVGRAARRGRLGSRAGLVGAVRVCITAAPFALSAPGSSLLRASGFRRAS